MRKSKYTWHMYKVKHSPSSPGFELRSPISFLRPITVPPGALLLSMNKFTPNIFGRIHRLHLCRWLRPSPNECPEYKTRQGACGVMVIVAGIGQGDTSSNPGLIAFHIALIPLGKVWIQLFSLQLWLNSRADWILQPWWGNWSRSRKTLNSNLLNSA